MSSEKDPAQANPSEPQFQQTALRNVTARDIQVGQIVQKIVYLGLPFNSQHLRFVQFLANTMYASLLVAGFLRLWQHGADGQTLVMLILGSGLMSLTGVYYAWFWKPRVEDKRSRRFRRLALVACVAIPLLTGSGFFVWSALPPPQVLVLVANFANSQNADYRDDRGVTGRILRNLRKATEPYPDVRVQSLDQTIRAQEGSKARAIGEQKKAAIVIWGDYDVSPTDVQVSVSFELLKFPDFPKVEVTANKELPIAPIAELNSFTLQTRLSNETSYLTLFTLGIVQFGRGDVDGAITRFSGALAQIDTTASFLNQSIVFFYRGSSYYSKSNYSKAISDFTEAIKFQPNLAGAYYNRGNSHFFKNDYLWAISDFTQAIKLQPNLAAAYNNRGVAYGVQGNYTQAFADLNQAIKLNPNDAGAYSNRGNVYGLQSNYTQAIADFNQAIKLQPNNPVAYNNRGNDYRAQGNYSQAIADFNQAIKFHPSYALAYYNRGLAYVEQENHPQAIADFNQAIQLQSGYADAYIGRGAAYVHQRNYTQAIADYTQAIKLKPDNVLAYYNRGNVYGTQSNYPQAIADFNQAIQLKPDYAEAHISRGAAYVHQRNYTQAIAGFNQVIKLKPDYAGAYYSKACIYGLQRDVKAALENLQRAIDLDAGFRGLAKTDAYFNNIRQDKQFQALVAQ